MREFANVDALKAAVGEVLGTSEWVTIDQDMIDRFAGVTGDDSWIHVDRERAKSSPWGTTIAHGFLTLSLITNLGRHIYRVDNVSRRLNYGCNKVRFPAPVPAGSRVRARLKILKVEDAAKGVLLTNEVTVELEGSERPACVAEQVAMLFPE